MRPLCPQSPEVPAGDGANLENPMNEHKRSDWLVWLFILIIAAGTIVFMFLLGYALEEYAGMLLGW